MGWGDAFSSAYQAASSTAKAGADLAMSSARAAADAVARAAEATKEAAVAGASAVRNAAIVGAAAVKDGAVAVAQGTTNVAGFGVRVVGDAATKTAGAAGSALAAPYRAAKQVFAPATAPAQTAVEPCPSTWAGKKARLEKRKQLINDGSNGSDSKGRAAADRLAANNDAVELARLSDDAYQQYPGGDFKYPNGSVPPPAGWKIVSPAELEARGVSVDALEDARAVVYETEDDWPGGKKTVLAFRGTADTDDAIVDYDQAMSNSTKQYTSAMKAGNQVAEAFGPDTVVTGHSLGGGKAQAAGAVSGLRGTMFNSAGLNPSTVDGMMPPASQFQQYRTTGDPLTGSQNSPLIQTAVGAIAGLIAMPLGAGMKLADAAQKALGAEGLSPEMADYADKAFKAFPRGVQNLVRDGNVLPPAIGSVHEVPAIDPDGKGVPLVSLAGQHSITSAINGIERQKTDDVATLSAH